MFCKKLDLLVVACGSFLEAERLQHTQLTKNELRTIKHYHKFFLYDKNESWKKKNTDSCFELFVKIIVVCEITAKFFQCCFISETYINWSFRYFKFGKGFHFPMEGGRSSFFNGETFIFSNVLNDSCFWNNCQIFAMLFY